MSGILKIAYKLLVNDRTKFAALLVGITFAVFLMIEMTSLFAGILSRSSATVINIGASIWVMDPAVQTVANTIPLPDYVLDEVRSIPGVKYAVPLYSGGALLKLRDGTYQAANVIGLDDTSLFGRPQVIAGNIEDIFAENAFIAIKDAEFYKLQESPDRHGVRAQRPPRRDRRHRAASPPAGCSACRRSTPPTTARCSTSRTAASPFPTCWSSRSRRRTSPLIKAQVDRCGVSGPDARQEFITKISDFYMYQTGIGTNMLLMTLISFIVGLSISGQTFYTFILENLDKFGALKAIGAKSRELIFMILFQATFVALDRLRHRRRAVRPPHLARARSTCRTTRP